MNHDPRRILRLKNPVQTYAWGSLTEIPKLLGEALVPGAPHAELWVGAHPKAPSEVLLGADPGTPAGTLPEWIEAVPAQLLGGRVVARFGANLPFLFKVLAAARPLSIQAHPSLEQARAGFARENRLRIPLDAPNRNYRDPNHKPECICALTPFWALEGLRSPAQIRALLKTLQLDRCGAGAALLATLDGSAARSGAENAEAQLREFWRVWLDLRPRADGTDPSGGERRQLIAHLATQARRLLDEPAATGSDSARNGAGPAGDHGPAPTAAPATADICRWILRLQQEYPDDAGILAPAILNLVRLAPGEALFLEAGQAHAYLEGLGVEVMANSDNVLRGGLTPKHVDVAELQRVLRFRPRPSRILRPAVARREPAGTLWRYPCPVAEFALYRLDLGAAPPPAAETGAQPTANSPVWRFDPLAEERAPGVELLFCSAGEATLRLAPGAADAPGPRALHLRRGQAALLPAAAGACTISGRATLYRVTVPE